MKQAAAGAGVVGRLVAGLLVLAIGAELFGMVIPNVWGNLQDSIAQREYAQARRIEAQQNREHQQSVDWQHE